MEDEDQLFFLDNQEDDMVDGAAIQVIPFPASTGPCPYKILSQVAELPVILD